MRLGKGTGELRLSTLSYPPCYKLKGISPSHPSVVDFLLRYQSRSRPKLHPPEDEN
ncbi:hypothetical protein LguiA_019058 [Lonicera macranthoides]